mmetsp:Transcript_5727/g.16516  ORF Transcript_5727/g.16516 Transcript_5727/m.16516 type:complete len:80 (+) Transcript_5727:1009-1248(+)
MAVPAEKERTEANHVKLTSTDLMQLARSGKKKAKRRSKKEKRQEAGSSTSGSESDSDDGRSSNVFSANLFQGMIDALKD